VQASSLQPTATPRLLAARSCFAPAEAATGERARARREAAIRGDGGGTARGGGGARRQVSEGTVWHGGVVLVSITIV